jgi:hypothetical protein
MESTETSNGLWCTLCGVYVLVGLLDLAKRYLRSNGRSKPPSNKRELGPASRSKRGQNGNVKPAALFVELRTEPFLSGLPVKLIKVEPWRFGMRQHDH